MAKHWVLLVTLLLSASVRAQEPPELSAIVFRIDSLASSDDAARDAPHRQAAVLPAPAPRPTRHVATGDLAADIEKRLAAIDAEQARTSERSPTLVDPLQSLAAVYEDAGNHEAAIATLQQAIWILRVNSGLFSLDQVDAVESLMAVRQANGQHAEAASLQGYLQQLATRNPEDARVASLMSRLADAEVASALELINPPPPPQFSVTLNDVPRPSVIRSPSLRALLAARRHYAAAILAGIRNGSENLPELISLENRLIDTLYFELAHPRLRYYEDGYSHFERYEPLTFLGVRMLQSKIDDTVKLRQSSVAVAKAMIELGDWYLVFSINGAALEQYKAAHDVLVADGVPQSSIDGILSPEVPPVLPFPLDAPERPHHGYVDAAIEVGPYGNARNIDVLATSDNTPRIIEKRLRQYLERSRIRPRFVDGQIARSDRFSARFYYDY